MEFAIKGLVKNQWRAYFTWKP